MRRVNVEILKDHSSLADKCYVAERFFDRLRGLIGRTRMEEGEGLLFPRCNNIHMWFMRMPIDVVLLSEVRTVERGTIWRVTSVRENARPWFPLPLFDWRASETLELPAGAIARHSIRTGDELCTS